MPEKYLPSTITDPDGNQYETYRVPSSGKEWSERRNKDFENAYYLNGKDFFGYQAIKYWDYLNRTGEEYDEDVKILKIGNKAIKNKYTEYKKDLAEELNLIIQILSSTYRKNIDVTKVIRNLFLNYFMRVDDIKKPHLSSDLIMKMTQSLSSI